ncbi:MAG: hypothetical protein AAF658_11095 [Myxococcota bacterium]
MTAAYPKKLQGEATLETRPRVLNIRLGRRALKRMDTEQRRALALFRAADFSPEPEAVDSLLRALGEDRGLDTLKIGRKEVDRLANTFRTKGYPLTDSGIRAFKMERGFSEVVRIGPRVAAAYARFLEGREAKLNVTREEWERLSPELRRAIRILMRIGQEPARLLEVREALGISSDDEDTSILVGKVSGEALIQWGRELGWSFDRDGFRRFRRILHAVGANPDDALVRFVADSVIAADEPVHDYERVCREDIILNRRTVGMLSQAKKAVRGEVKLSVLRGSYSNPEGRGAHPHAGGGAVDLSVKPYDAVKYAIVTLRREGFAAWYRSRNGRHHIHAIAIGDRELSAAAEWQIKAFFEGRDGRTRGGEDPHAKLDVRPPSWTDKYRVRHL